MRELLAASLVPGAIAWVAILLLRRTRAAALLADRPNERSLHTRPTPRLGGLGLVAGLLPMGWALAEGAVAVALACALLLAVVSLADDAGGLPIEVRLPAHGVAAAVLVLAAHGHAPGPGPWIGLEAAAAVVAIAWMTNLFNFMDGADGLAGGMAVIGFATLAAGAALAGAPGLAGIAAAIASASAGFLAHNFPPARVFLGDSGSIPLGFLAAALGWIGVQSGAWPLAFPILAFSPFIVDATVTIARRLARGERVWMAHRSHYYQRLVLAGWSRRRLAAAAYALMLAAGASALWLRAEGPGGQSGIISGWAVAYVLLLIAIDRKTRKMVSPGAMRSPSTLGKPR